jgi:thiol-disulfide isomerase/thioredoxin
VVALAIWAGMTALQEPELPSFQPSGEPIELPPEGSIPAVSAAEFEQMLVGQHGRPVIVNIWASWCAPCRTEMPVLQEAAETYASEAVILGVASNDDQEAARDFLQDLGITYPNAFDASGQIQAALELSSYPTTYVFGADGTLRARVNGGISEQRLAGLIEDALR